jgi:cell division protein FtsB
MLNTLKWFLITILIILTLGIIGVGVYASQRLSSVERKFNVEIKEIRKEIKELKKGIEQLKNKVFVEPKRFLKLTLLIGKLIKVKSIGLK